MADPVRYARMTTEELRETFLVESMFAPGKISLAYIDVDRTVVGGAIPMEAPLALSADDALRSTYFTERRELGVLNIGGKGTVAVGDKAYVMEKLDCLYIGRGNKDISFASADPKTPAAFYLLSYPAHTAYPVTLARKADAAAVPLGSEANVNKRTIYKYIHPDGIKSCQLVMGFTQLAVGSAWNTMPAHTHMRRSEVYLYFDLAPESRVFHMMGPGQQTRHLVVADRQIAISPSWSIHSGVGTTNYSFCWGMGGENQTFDDMDGIPIKDLK
jgi:4-deoxy-L-threo-5-hexosulose-uronate ketol-isomerase